jgi:hypothetical protein
VRGCLCVCSRARVLVCVRARLFAWVLVCVCARTTTAGLACLHRAHPHLPGDPCAHWPGPQLILLTRIAVPVQWRCRDERKDVKGKDTFSLPEWWRCNSGNLPHFAFVLRALLTNAPLLPSGTSLQHVQCHFCRRSATCLRGLP